MRILPFKGTCKEQRRAPNERREEASGGSLTTFIDVCMYVCVCVRWELQINSWFVQMRSLYLVEHWIAGS